LPFCPYPVAASATAHSKVLRATSGRLARDRALQPLRVGDAASRGHLVRRPAHGHFARRKVPVGDRHCRLAPRCRSSLPRALRCRRSPLRVLRCRQLPLRVATPTRGLGHTRSPPCRWPSHGGGQAMAGRPYRGLAVANHPCREPSRGRPPSFLAAFTTKTQKERVEQF
ncbi:hypothetical protein BHE74_00045426, partial [Ensete ventricosum]